MCRGIGAQFFLAQTELLWGRMLARRGRHEDLDRAVELLEQARSSAIAQGYASVLDRADEALRRVRT
jgi:thiamine pyrophosphate-dependent acetolactate synthase large subunit-like protein